VIGRVIVVSVTVCCMCVCVCTVQGKWLELSTTNFIHIYSMAVARHVLTQRSKGQGHKVKKTVTGAWLLAAALAIVLLLPAWDCTSNDCLGF